MKRQLLGALLISFTFFGLRSQNTNLIKLISANEWNSMFPNRAGLQSNHKQGVKTDFYSFNNFKKAISEMSNYRISFRKKSGIAGQITTVTNKSDGTKYEISSVPNHWYSHGGRETTLEVDFGDFINTSSQFNNKRELGAFLANISKETTGGWKSVGSGVNGDHSKWGLHWVEELNPNHNYRKTDSNYPPSLGQRYIGRGPIQLSYNDNYGQVSAFLYNDKTILLDDPGAVSRDGVLAFKTAIWFWMMPQCPKPSCHQVMQNLWKTNPGEYSANKMFKKGFAHTNNIINGGLECRSNTSAAFKEKVTLRSNLYKHYLGLLGVSQSQIDQENTGDYSTQCFTSKSNTMQDYASCDVQKSGPICSEPSLGTDQTICGNPVLLDAGVSLETGEKIKWYKNDNLISSAKSKTYQATSSGTYKAEITSTGCSRFDVITLTPGGNLQASPTNDGKYCTNGPTTSVKINVSGGAGFYNFYKNSSGGDPVGSGGSLEVSGNDVAKGSSHTYYVEEGGAESVLGLSEKTTEDNSAATDITLDLGWNNYNQLFTVYSKTTLKSIDFHFSYIKDQEHSLHVKIYKSGTKELVASKLIKYKDYGSANWSDMNTIDLNIELEPGAYELSTIESKMLIWQTVLAKGSFEYDKWKVDGIVSLDGAISPGNRGWGIVKNVNQGTFNWRFSSGSSDGCGRFPVTVTHDDCALDNNGTTSTENIINKTLSIYPNPASNLVNISYEMNTFDNIKIEIYNAVGLLMKTKLLTNTNGIQTVNFNSSDMAEGIYFIKLNSSNGNHTKTVSIIK